MTKVSLKEGKSIICERCGNWHKSETDYKKHLRTTCNADLLQIERNESRINNSSIQSSLASNQGISSSQTINQQQTSTPYTNLNGKLRPNSIL